MSLPLLAELTRRRVFRALVAYGIAAFAVLQIIEPIIHGLHWPDSVLSYVVAVLAVGFPIVVSLAWIFDVNGGGIERTVTVASRPVRGARLALLVVGIGLVASAPGVIWYFVWPGHATPKQKTTPSTATAPSIAVLAFADMSPGKDQEYFADGLAEELLNLLAKVPGLRVAARTSAFSFKGKNEDARIITEKLKVGTLLEGSVRKAGDQIRITTKLISGADGYDLWSETYDRKLTDVFAVQDEIAQAVVAALKLKLLPGQAPTSKDHRTSNPEVYTQYLLGRRFLNRETRDGYLRAVQAYDKALALDPGFAPAWSGLALATFWISDTDETAATVAEGQRQALAAAEKAVALAPDLAEGYATRGFVRSVIERDWAGALSDFERALVLNPEDATTMRDYARSVLGAVGRLPEAIVFARKATELDPLNAQAWKVLGTFLLESGQPSLARDALNRSLEINPEQALAGPWLGVALLIERQPAAALAQFERSTLEAYRLQGSALVHHDLGHPRESQQALNMLITKYGQSGAYQIAQVYAWRGEADGAFEWLERAYSNHDGGLLHLKVDPLMRKVRGDPRYASLLKKMKLPLD